MPTLDEVKKMAEEYMKKEMEMLYNMTFLNKGDAMKLKEWLITHPHYQRLQGFSGFIANENKTSSS